MIMPIVQHSINMEYTIAKRDTGAILVQSWARDIDISHQCYILSCRTTKTRLFTVYTVDLTL